MKKNNSFIYLILAIGVVLYLVSQSGERKAIDSPLIYPTYSTSNLNGLNIVPQCSNGNIVSTTTEINFRKSTSTYAAGTYIAFDSDKTDTNLECFTYSSFYANYNPQFITSLGKTSEGYDIIKYTTGYMIRTGNNPIFSLVEDSACTIPLDRNSVPEYAANNREALKYSVYTGLDSYNIACGTVSCTQLSPNSAKCTPYCNTGSMCHLGDIHKCLDGTESSFRITDCQAGCIVENGNYYCSETRCSGTGNECSGNTLVKCVNNEKQPVEVCPLGCDNIKKACIQDCKPNEFFCDGLQKWQCSASGYNKTLIETCAVGCENNVCLKACTPGNYSCDGKFQTVCNAAGTAYTNVKECPFICEDGACKNNCVPNVDKSCNENQVTVCSANGASYVPTGQTCAFKCENGACVDYCTANQKVCIADKSYTCNTQGTGYDPTKTQTCALGCDAGVCKTCTTGQTKCENGIQSTCNLDKISYTQTKVCDSGCGNAYVCKDCTPGITTQCNAANLEICDSSGISFAYKETCSKGCQNGACLVCVPGTLSCSSGIKQVCSSDGKTISTVKTCPQGCYGTDCDAVVTSLQSSNFIYGSNLAIPVLLSHTVDSKPISSVTITGKIEDINKVIKGEFSGITNTQGIANLVFSGNYTSGQYKLLLSAPYQGTNIADTKDFSIVTDVRVTTTESPIQFLDALSTIKIQTKDAANQLVTVDGLEVMAEIDNKTIQTAVSQSGLGTYDVTLLSPTSGQLVLKITPTQGGSKTTMNTLSFLLKKPYIRITPTYPLQTSIGKSHDIVVDIFNTNNVREEADNVIIKSTDPSGSVETIPMLRVGKGLYTYKMTFAKAGTYSMLIIPERKDYEVKSETITITVSEGLVVPPPQSPTMIIVYVLIGGVAAYLIYKYVLKGGRRK
jgi:hypothetical protein